MEPGFRFQAQRLKVDGPGEGGGCRVVAGKVEGYKMVSHLSVAHSLVACAVLALKPSLEEQRQQTWELFVRLPAFSDHPVNGLVDKSLCRRKLLDAGSGSLCR